MWYHDDIWVLLGAWAVGAAIIVPMVFILNAYM